MQTGYDDIIHLPHYEPRNHPRMEMSKRAAQFMPFAAVTGHADAIAETGRITDEKIIMEEDDLAGLDRKLTRLRDMLHDQPDISIIYFVKDAAKDGGEYRRITGAVRKIDDYERRIVMTDGEIIELDDILEIDGDIFE